MTIRYSNNTIFVSYKKGKIMKNLKVNITDIKVGSKILTWFNNEVFVLEINSDKALKPLVVSNGIETQYFHFSQIDKILS